MQKPNRSIIILLAALCIVFFSVLIIPNAKASHDIEMITMFEPDEGVFIPYILKMNAPAENLKEFLKQYVFYGVYSYGFPYFSASALVLLPLSWFNQAQNLPLSMLILRQVISVLPMMLGILLLVYMHDGFRTYRSPLLLTLLMAVPGTLQNGFWWHPDGMVVLLSALVLFLLWKDERRIGLPFFLAAAACGILTATKVMGVYFFLAVGMTLVWSLLEKKITFSRFIFSGLFFIAIMAAAFFIANPYLFYRTRLIGYLETMMKETNELSRGYGLVYEKGLYAAWPTMRRFYGEFFFLASALIGILIGLWDKHTRFFSALTLAWLLPLTYSVVYITHFKYQYWLPVALPFLSHVIAFFPRAKGEIPSGALRRVVMGAGILAVALQIFLFTQQNSATYAARVNREHENPLVAFFEEAQSVLSRFELKGTNAYYDYRLYVPSDKGWKLENSYDILTYEYIQTSKFDFLFLLESRMLDYLQQNARGVNPSELEKGRLFYQDARNGAIENYLQLYRNPTARLFVREDLCLNTLSKEECEALSARAK